MAGSRDLPVRRWSCVFRDRRSSRRSGGWGLTNSDLDRNWPPRRRLCGQQLQAPDTLPNCWGIVVLLPLQRHSGCEAAFFCMLGVVLHLPLYSQHAKNRHVIECVPDRVFVIHCDWIINLHALDGLPDVINVLFKFDLGRVDADHYQPLFFIFLCPCADVRKRTSPINTGIGPEIHEHNSSAWVRPRQALRIDPPGRAVERRQIARPKSPSFANCELFAAITPS